MGWRRSRLGSALAILAWWSTVLSAGAMSQDTDGGIEGGKPLRMTGSGSRRACIVVGAAGEPEYGAMFRSWSDEWKSVFGPEEITWLRGEDGFGAPPQTALEASTTESSRSIERVDGGGDGGDRQAVLEWVSKGGAEFDEHWLILIGHGTHDAQSTKFNLVGPDLSAADLASAMSGRGGRWIVLVCASCSGPFLEKIAGPNRIVVTATKSGAEQSFSRFGQYVSESAHDAAADLDHDHAVSVLEMFLSASARVKRYYEDRGLLSSEQALIDDTGDGKGTPAAFYRGVRAVKSAVGDARLDGALAKRTIAWRQEPLALGSREVFEQIELELERLRGMKDTMDPDAYYLELERLFRRRSNPETQMDGSRALLK